MNEQYAQPPYNINNDDAASNGIPQRYQQPDTFYYDENAQLNHDASGWYELSCVEAGLAGLSRHDSITKLACDPLKELVWAGTESGMLHAHYAPDMSRIVSSYIGQASSNRAISQSIRDLVVSKSAVLAAVGYGLAIVSRGGVCRASVRADTIRDAKALALNPLSDTQVCIGGESRMLAVVDCEHQRILRQATLRGATGVTAALWAAPEGAPSLAIFSTATGRISLCDPSTMREINAVAAFAGAATHIASSGYYLAATGLNTRSGVSYLEQHVKIFDIRAMDTPLPSVMFQSPPMFVTFDSYTSSMYNTDGAMWILSPNGQMQCMDISSLANEEPPYPLSAEIQLDAGSDVFTAMAVSSQGLLFLGDTGGFIHQWAASDNAKMNEASEQLWTSPITTDPPNPSIRLDDLLTSDLGATIPKCALPDFDNAYLTDELFGSAQEKKARGGAGRLAELRSANGVDTTTQLFWRDPFARFPLRISDDVLGSAKRQSFVGYAQAPPGFVRNSIAGHKKPPVVRGMPGRRGETNNRRGSGASDQPWMNSNDKKSETSSQAPDLSKPAVKSFYVEMDLVAWESSEGFDFLKYNRSALFCGLENVLPNVYVNAVVQVLYYSPPLRSALACHGCDREWCISCELGFLFHMFDLGGAGMACEAGNFTKAFMRMANAGALGLLDGPHALPLPQRIENFSRYLLEQLHADDGAGSTVSSLFGADTLSYGKFMPSNTDWERTSRPFQHTLIYDGIKQEDSFCDLLQNSLSHELDPTRAFCEASGQFETMSQRRTIKSPPNVMLLGCNGKAAEYNRWWLQDDGSGAERSRTTGRGFVPAMNSSDPRFRDETAFIAIGKEKKLMKSFKLELEGEICVSQVDEEGSSFGYDGYSGESAEDTGDSVGIYDISFVIVHVPPSNGDSDSNWSGRNHGGHLVAYIRVPLEYRTKENAVVNDAQWWVFNDFVISPCESFDEVAAFDRRWKMPCLIGYVRRDVARRVKQREVAQAPSVREVIGSEDINAAKGLSCEEEAPGRGSLLALDCEFVMIGRDEADIFGDGTRKVIVPARRALARVSVIRGDGPRKGVALIDDYVAVREPVVDYLTRFSGLSEGDLEQGSSAYRVSELKRVYRKLRCLVDAGCIFVGHGLKSDFRIINFVVPSEQVVDTVTLYRMPKKRLLGLKFLTSALLGGEIQTNTHDSIEDADAALRLYEVYQRLKGRDGGPDVFEQTVTDLYTYGYAHGWKADANDPFRVDWDGEKAREG